MDGARKAEAAAFRAHRVVEGLSEKAAIEKMENLRRRLLHALRCGVNIYATHRFAASGLVVLNNAPLADFLFLGKSQLLIFQDSFPLSSSLPCF